MSRLRAGRGGIELRAGGIMRTAMRTQQQNEHQINVDANRAAPPHRWTTLPSLGLTSTEADTIFMTRMMAKISSALSFCFCIVAFPSCFDFGGSSTKQDIFADTYIFIADTSSNQETWYLILLMLRYK